MPCVVWHARRAGAVQREQARLCCSCKWTSTEVPAISFVLPAESCARNSSHAPRLPATRHNSSSASQAELSKGHIREPPLSVHLPGSHHCLASLDGRMTSLVPLVPPPIPRSMLSRSVAAAAAVARVQARAMSTGWAPLDASKMVTKLTDKPKVSDLPAGRRCGCSHPAPRRVIPHPDQGGQGRTEVWDNLHRSHGGGGLGQQERVACT